MSRACAWASRDGGPRARGPGSAPAWTLGASGGTLAGAHSWKQHGCGQTAGRKPPLGTLAQLCNSTDVDSRAAEEEA